MGAHRGHDGAATPRSLAEAGGYLTLAYDRPVTWCQVIRPTEITCGWPVAVIVTIGCPNREHWAVTAVRACAGCAAEIERSGCCPACGAAGAAFKVTRIPGVAS